MLALDKVGKIYPNGVHALERFSAKVSQGEIVAIIGGSGCGKSTLLRAIAGLDRATSGAVTLDDTAILSPHAKIGIIFQEPRLLPWLTVADNIGFGLSDLPAAARREKIAAALARVGLGLGWMFVVAAELIGASEGLGYLLLDGQQLGKPAQILAAIVIFAILGKLTDWLIEVAALPFLRWQDAFGKQSETA